jgi:glycosyltransferase involved in cell wall biosynthesis
MSAQPVSVVIPSYNHAEYVTEAVESALRQTSEKLEVIVIDDGSTDDTPIRLEPYRGRIRYIRQENRGLPAARNVGIRHANGEWVAFLDADDLWHPQKTEAQLGAIARTPDAAVVGSPETALVPDELPRNPSLKLLGVRDFLVSTPITASSTMVRRSCLEEVGLFDESLTSGEDRDMWLRLAARFAVYQVASPCWWYRHHEGQMSQNASRMFDNARRVLDKFFRVHSEYGELRPLAKGFMHLAAAQCYYEQGARISALTHLLQSWRWHRSAISDRHCWIRLKLLVKFSFGEMLFRQMKAVLFLRQWSRSLTRS